MTDKQTIMKIFGDDCCKWIINFTEKHEELSQEEIGDLKMITGFIQGVVKNR